MFRRTLSFPVALTLALGGLLGCDIEIEEPVVAATARFQPIGPASIGGPKQGRVSLRMRIENGGKQDLLLESVEIDGQLVSNFAAPKVIPAKGSFTFQNCNCDESVAYVIGRANDDGLALDDLHVFQILEAEQDYLRAIGAVGDEVPAPPDPTVE